MSDPAHLWLAFAMGVALKLLAERLRSTHLGATPPDALDADESEASIRVLSAMSLPRQALWMMLLLLMPRRFLARMRREIAQLQPKDP